ncbi:MAG TPA: DUF1835 domain-containing protein [Pyrinomonadaceae bacterium]
MIYHVLPGDAQLDDFRKTGIDGEVIVFREAFVTGPIDALETNEFWDQRASYILSEYGDDEIVYQEKVADEILRLDDVADGDEVNLWFEFELFCSVNLWYCLHALKGSGSYIFRVAPIDLEPDDVWKGFGEHAPDDLRSAFEARMEFTDEDVVVGARLWSAYRDRDLEKLRLLGEHRSPALPFLKEVTGAASEIDTLPAAILRDIENDGINTFAEVFPEFQKRAGVYGFGDAQVQKLLDKV